MSKPQKRPGNPCFSSGPCAKRPGWTTEALRGASLGRSHRSAAGKAKLGELIERSRALLGIPPDYRIAIVPGSDTGAVETALWSFLGERGVDVLTWESFGETWANDITGALKLTDVRVLAAPYGRLPDLAQVDFERDVVFAWNGTTSGVCVPDGGWIAHDRKGLTICDATSAAFAMELPWEKLDVTTWSWQKALGGEAQHGMLTLSPRAIDRLLRHAPRWPVPKLFRLTQGGKLIEGMFNGDTINTPSLLAVEDHLDALAWAERIGGQPALIARSQANLAAVEAWVERTGWVRFLAETRASRSWTSICLAVAQPGLATKIARRLEQEKAAYDIEAYRHAPPGLRLWGGTTVETSDLHALFPWLEWAYGEVT
jgi:phosphoserine aminotransferase